MSIVRISEFRARTQKGDALWQQLSSINSLLETSAGAQLCLLLRDYDDPACLVTIELWDSLEAQQASMENVPAETFQQALQLLAERPQSAYYHY